MGKQLEFLREKYNWQKNYLEQINNYYLIGNIKINKIDQTSTSLEIIGMKEL